MQLNSLHIGNPNNRTDIILHESVKPAEISWLNYDFLRNDLQITLQHTHFHSI